MNEILMIARKELISVFRDYRSLIATLLLPIIIMPVIMYAPTLLFGTAAQDTEKNIQKVGMVGLPPAVIEALKTAKVEPVAVLDPEKMVRDKELSAAVIFDGTSYTIYGRTSGASTQSTLVVDKVEKALGKLKDAAVAERLKAKGLDPSVLEPFKIETKDASRKEERAAGLLAFLIPYFLLFFIQIGGSPIAVESTAGEKEKGTLEALLAAPVPLIKIVLGKALAVLTMALMAALAALTGLLLGGSVVRRFVAQNIGSDDSANIGGGLALNPAGYAAVLLTSVLFALLVVSIMISLALYARTFQEAQSFLTPMQLILIVPMLFLQFADFLKIQDWFFAIPLFNVMLALDTLVKGASSAPQLALTWISTLVYAGLALYMAYRNFGREGVLFRN
jgi:sodium transport system permease protein